MSVVSKKAPGQDCGICRETFDLSSDSVTHTGVNGEKHVPMCRNCFRGWVDLTGKCPVCQEAINVRSLFSWTEWVGYSTKKFAANALIAGMATTCAAALAPLPASGVLMVGVGTVVGQQLNHRVDPGLFWNNQNRVIPVIGGTALVISLTDTIKKLTGLTPMQIGDMSSSFGIASGISAAAVLAVEKIRRSNAVAISLAIGGTGCAMLALPLSITTVAAISGVAAGTLALLIG